MTALPMTLSDASTVHLLTLSAEGRSERTRRNYLSYENRFLDYLAGRGLGSGLEQLSPANVRQATVAMERSPAGRRGGESARSSFVTVLKVWAGFLTREGILPSDPLAMVRKPRVRKIAREPFTRQEMNALLQAASAGRTATRDTLLLLLLMDTGARITEVTGLTEDRLHLERDAWAITVLGKGNRERRIPIGDPTVPGGGPLLRALRAYLAQREAMFNQRPRRRTDRLLLSHSGYALTSNGARGALVKLGAAAGVANCHPHRFRHTYATWYLTVHAGDEIGLRRILGHVSDVVLRDYVHLASATVAQRAAAAAPSTTWLKSGLDVPKPVRRSTLPVGEAWGATPKREAPPPSVPAPAAPDPVAALVDLVKQSPELRAAFLRALVA